MSSSRLRLYLDLKLSPLELSRARNLPYGIFNRYALTPAQYIKEMTSKWSIFEKPFYDTDSPRAMNFTMPVPDWPTRYRWNPPSGPNWPDPPPGSPPGSGFFPPPRTVTYVFGPGVCSLSNKTGECGETITLNGWIGLTSPGRGLSYRWDVTSSNPDAATILSIDDSLSGTSTSVKVQLSDSFTGTVMICARINQVGSYVKKVVYEIPEYFGRVKVAPSWIPSLQYAMANLIPISEIRGENESWPCGCIGIEVECACAGAVWDTETSAETVAPGSDCIVAITNVGAIEKTWSVDGTGFWLDAGYTITELVTTANSIMLYADDDSCGSATITVCEATGYVRSTVGLWGNGEKMCATCESGPVCGCYTYLGKYRESAFLYCVWDPIVTCGYSCGEGWGSGYGYTDPCPYEVGEITSSTSFCWRPSGSTYKSYQVTKTIKEEWNCA